MTRGPVFAFRMNLAPKRTVPLENNQKYDILATAKDLLDTWGPGYLGGIIYASDRDSSAFHWSRDVKFERCSVTFDTRTKIVVGTPIIINDNCSNHERECRENSSFALQPLSSFRSYWGSLDEIQGGFQIGNYALLQFVASRHKICGKTLKECMLESKTWGQLRSYLKKPWGVQVSYCTSVARRVPLRELVAGLLPVFAGAFPSQRDLWEELETEYNLISAFQNDDSLTNWFNTIPLKYHDYVSGIIHLVLNTFQDTGIDREKKNFLIAWPWTDDLDRGFKVPYSESGGSYWAQVLAILTIVLRSRTFHLNA
ncbi:MAG: hypothetical protein M1834_004228 [Cirrosporium novae-zelandiae]|nr:MAG: hypothetical protein M1834_004228 [Cirrosporium novae-zelandiae]